MLASADFLVKVQKEVEKEEQDIKDHLNSLYSTYGKLKDGKGSQRDFDEERITVLTMLRKKKTIQNIQHLHNARNKCPKLSKTFNIYIMQGTNVRICFVDTL